MRTAQNGSLMMDIMGLLKSAADVAPAFTALSAIFGAGIAFRASLTWHKTLKTQRADECIGAIHEMCAAVNRCFALKEKTRVSQDNLWKAYDAAWVVSWRRFEESYIVARRYYQRLPRNIPSEIEKILFELETLCQIEWHVRDLPTILPNVAEQRDAIKEQLANILLQIENSLPKVAS
jgi:hypothetical protein